MKRLMSLFLVLAATLGAMAQQEMNLTIDQAVELAVKNNHNYLISQEEVKQYRYRLRESFGFLPQVTLEGAKNLDEKLMVIEIPPFYPGGEATRATLDFTMNYEFTFQVVQPVFAGGKIFYSFKNAKLDLDIAREKHRDAKKEVALNVKKVFFNILVMKELLKAHEEALLLAETNYRNIGENFKLGMVSKYDLLRAELAVTGVKPNLTNVKKILDLSLANLKMMTGIADDVTIKVVGELTFHEYQLELAGLIRKALVNRSEIRQLQLEQEKAKNLLKIAYGQFLPNVSLIGRWSYRSNTFSLKGDNWDDYYSINLGISYPIFTGFKRTAQIGEINVMKKILNLNHQQLSDGTRLQVEDLVLTVKQEYENIQNGLKSMEAAEEGARIADLTYREGLISILELNSSTNDLTRAKVNFFQAVYNYNIALAQLEKISGVEFKEASINGGMNEE